jgi:hypothetical protein
LVTSISLVIVSYIAALHNAEYVEAKGLDAWVGIVIFDGVRFDEINLDRMILVGEVGGIRVLAVFVGARVLAASIVGRFDSVDFAGAMLRAAGIVGRFDKFDGINFVGAMLSAAGSSAVSWRLLFRGGVVRSRVSDPAEGSHACCTRHTRKVHKHLHFNKSPSLIESSNSCRLKIINPSRLTISFSRPRSSTGSSRLPLLVFFHSTRNSHPHQSAYHDLLHVRRNMRGR